MSDPLALKYRPKRFGDFIGQPATRLILEKMCQEHKVNRPLIFAGTKGSGKTSLARVVAATLNCEAEDLERVRPCTQCPSCKSIAAGTSLAVIEQDGASSGLVDDIRKITDMLQYSVDSVYRIVMLDEVQSLSRSAFNALLKTLEEPPPQTVFILLTTEPQKILDTIISRCLMFEFKKIPTEEIIQRLSYVAEQEQITIDQPLITLLADRADGSVRDALMSLDQCWHAGITNERHYRGLLGEQDFAPALITSMLQGNQVEAFLGLDKQLSRYGDVGVVQNALVACLRDVLILQGSGVVRSTDTALQARQALAQSLPAAKVIQAMRIIWEGQGRFKTVVSSKAQMDLLVVLLTEVLTDPKYRPAPPVVERKRMTIEELNAAI